LMVINVQLSEVSVQFQTIRKCSIVISRKK